MSLNVTPGEIVERAEATGNLGLLARAPGWGRVPLGEVASVVNGAAFPSRHFNGEGRGTPLIRIRDVGASQSSTWFDGAWEPQHLVHHGDVVVGMDGDFRVARWGGGDALLNQRVCRIDVDESRYNSRLLVLVLQGYLDAIWRETSSVTVKHLSSRSVAAVPLPRPPLDEQRRIVDLLDDHLSRLDAASASIEIGTRRLAALRRSALAELHAGESTQLGDLAIDAGYGTSEKCVVDGPGPAVVRIPNLVAGSINLDDEKRIADPGADVTRYALARGDVLIVRTNGSVDLIGRSAVVQPGIHAAYASYLIRYRVDESQVRPAWVHAMLSTPQVRARIETLAASSAGQHNLSLGKLNLLELPLPSLADQDAGLQGLAELDREASRLQAALTVATLRAVRLRSALLAAAFSGHLTGSRSDVGREATRAGTASPLRVGPG